MSDKERLVELLTSFGIGFEDLDGIALGSDHDGCSGAHWASTTFRFDDKDKFKVCEFDA